MRSTHVYTAIYFVVGGPAFNLAIVACILVTPIYVAALYLAGLGVTGIDPTDLLTTLGLGLVAISLGGVGLYLLLIHHAAAALGHRHAVTLIWPHTKHVVTVVRNCILRTWRAISPALSYIDVFRVIEATLLVLPVAWNRTPSHLSTRWAASSQPQLA